MDTESVIEKVSERRVVLVWKSLVRDVEDGGHAQRHEEEEYVQDACGTSLPWKRVGVLQEGGTQEEPSDEAPDMGSDTDFHTNIVQIPSSVDGKRYLGGHDDKDDDEAKDDTTEDVLLSPLCLVCVELFPVLE